MALVGKELGKDVGQWFGPSTAAGAIKYVLTLRCMCPHLQRTCRTLVHAFPEAGLGVSVAADGGVIYQSDVYAVSHSVIGPPQRYARLSWGDRGVLILIGIRLGLDGVNPVYYDTIKVCPLYMRIVTFTSYMRRLYTPFPSPSASPAAGLPPHITLLAPKPTTYFTSTRIMPGLPFHSGHHPGSVTLRRRALTGILSAQRRRTTCTPPTANANVTAIHASRITSARLLHRHRCA